MSLKHQEYKYNLKIMHVIQGFVQHIYTIRKFKKD